MFKVNADQDKVGTVDCLDSVSVTSYISFLGTWSRQKFQVQWYYVFLNHISSCGSLFSLIHVKIVSNVCTSDHIMYFVLAVSYSHIEWCYYVILYTFHTYRSACIYTITKMQRLQYIDHNYQAKLLMRGPSENSTTNPPSLGPPHPLEDNLFLSPASPASHP